MKKQNVRISYSGSGVNTLSGFGTFFYIVAVISIIVAIVSFASIVGMSYAGIFITNAISSLAAGAICKGLSTVAETALYKKSLLEKQYNFVLSEYPVEDSVENVTPTEESIDDGIKWNWKCPHIGCTAHNTTKKERYMTCQSCGREVELWSNGEVARRK